MFGKISPQDTVKRMSCWQHRPEDCDVLALRRQMMIGKLGLLYVIFPYRGNKHYALDVEV